MEILHGELSGLFHGYGYTMAAAHLGLGWKFPRARAQKSNFLLAVHREGTQKSKK